MVTWHAALALELYLTDAKTHPLSCKPWVPFQPNSLDFFFGIPYRKDLVTEKMDRHRKTILTVNILKVLMSVSVQAERP